MPNTLSSKLKPDTERMEIRTVTGMWCLLPRSNGLRIRKPPTDTLHLSTNLTRQHSMTPEFHRRCSPELDRLSHYSDCGPASTGVSTPRSGEAATEAIREPYRIYLARELVRRADKPGPYYYFPESYYAEIFRGNRHVISENYILYNPTWFDLWHSGKPLGFGMRPSASGRIEIYVHRFFRPEPRR